MAFALQAPLVNGSWLRARAGRGPGVSIGSSFPQAVYTGEIVKSHSSKDADLLLIQLGPPPVTAMFSGR